MAAAGGPQQRPCLSMEAVEQSVLPEPVATEPVAEPASEPPLPEPEPEAAAAEPEPAEPAAAPEPDAAEPPAELASADETDLELQKLQAAMAKEGLELPAGWRVVLVERKNAKDTKAGPRSDKHFLAPSGQRFLSYAKVRVFLLNSIAKEAEEEAPLPPRAGRAGRLATAPASADSSELPPRAAKRAAPAEPRAGAERKSAKSEPAPKKAKAAKAEAAGEVGEEDDEPRWHYRSPKGVVMGPFSLNELRSFRAGFEHLNKLASTQVWRVGADEELDCVPLLAVLDGALPEPQ